MTEYASYSDLIARKAVAFMPRGFDSIPDLHPDLFPHQRAVTEFALRAGCAAMFMDCVTGDTLIQTIEGPRRIDDLAAEGKPIVVLSRSADGKVRWSLATAPFRKGRGVMFKVTLEDGQTIRATAGHRFLTPQGWTACGDLSVGQQLVCAPDLHPSIQGIAQQALPRDVPHCSGTRAGSTDRCSSRYRRYGQRLLRAADTARELAPSLAYALALDGCSLQTDGLAHTPARSPSRPHTFRPSMPGSIRLGMNVVDARECPPHSSCSEVSGESSRISRLFLSASRPVRSWRERLQDLFQSSLGGPLAVSCKVSSVVSIQELGEEYKYDMHVPGDECYLGNGIWCHNTGLGKSFSALEWGRVVVELTNMPVLMLAPLAVGPQHEREAKRFGIDAKYVRSADEIDGARIYITNYERVDNFIVTKFSGIILDESSILKSFAGVTTRKLITLFASTAYRLCCTATPAPNDHTELGTHSEFLGVMRRDEMLPRWFINDTMTASQHWRIKGHAVRDFWRWVASWARCVSMPSDLGFDDGGYVLPEITTHEHTVKADRFVNAGEEKAGKFVGQQRLFRMPDTSATSIHAEKRLTSEDRADLVAECIDADPDEQWLVWVDTDYDAENVMARIDDAKEVRGSMPLATKEDRLDAFSRGELRVLVTKPSIAGYGLNWQQCARMAFAGLSFSYENYYQAVRRCWRFGQTRPVEVHIAMADTEAAIKRVIDRKAGDHLAMKREMQIAMREAHQSHVRKSSYQPKMEAGLPAWMTA